MDVVYPNSPAYEPREGEYPVRSVPVPNYQGYRLGVATDPAELPTPEIVHVHTPFTIGWAGLRLANRVDVPVVATYHTILAERVDQLTEEPLVQRTLRYAIRRIERRFYESVDLVTTPTPAAKRHLQRTVDPDAAIEVVSNGIDTSLFEPVPTDAFRAEYDLDAEPPILGYTGRHSDEKHLTEVIDAADRMDVTLLLAGDGPQRSELERYAEALDGDVRFLGFLDRTDLPAFYSTIDVFVFPGRLETQGLVALEASACGTPVVAANAGALRHTVLEGVTGYHYPPGDVDGLCATIERTLEEYERLHELCLRRRDMISVEDSVDRLDALYGRLLDRR